MRLLRFIPNYIKFMPGFWPNEEVPEAIRNLRLCGALAHCASTKVEDAFEQSNDENLYVYDDETLHHSTWVNELPDFLSKTFHAQNPNGRTLVLLPLDGLIFRGRDIIEGGICDCALLTDKEMSFVEFKTNVTSLYEVTIHAHAQKAVGQLWHTYQGIIQEKCQKVGIAVAEKVSVDFYVVFDTHLCVTGVQASLLDLQTDFLMRKHYPLYFQNEKQFE